MQPDLPAALAAGGIGAVVVLPGVLPPEGGARLSHAVEASLGSPAWTDGERQVYRVAPPRR